MRSRLPGCLDCSLHTALTGRRSNERLDRLSAEKICSSEICYPHSSFDFITHLILVFFSFFPCLKLSFSCMLCYNASLLSSSSSSSSSFFSSSSTSPPPPPPPPLPPPPPPLPPPPLSFRPSPDVTRRLTELKRPTN